MSMSFLIIFIKNIMHSMFQFFSFGKNKLTNTLNIYIKTNNGNTLLVDLNPQWDIGNVKELVAPKLGLEPDEVKIIFAGKELSNTISLSECDLGQQSILHAIKVTKCVKVESQQRTSFPEEIDGEASGGSKPLCGTLTDLTFSSSEDTTSSPLPQSPNTNEGSLDSSAEKVHFFVFCATCKELRSGKLRVRCNCCKSGAFTVHSDPQGWDDVIEAKKITGQCENVERCENILQNSEPVFAEFYFKCSEHCSLGESDQAVPLYHIRPNIWEIPCLACADVCSPVFVFHCEERHVTCLDCFRQYCRTRLADRQFFPHPEFGYTLNCPAGCKDSYITEIHHFRLLTDAQYNQYQRFATEEFVLQSGGVLCPQPGCGMGILIDEGCRKVACVNGCGYVFCRDCLQGFHIGECQTVDRMNSTANCSYSVDPERAAHARWDEASKVAIKILTKPCPNCRTPTERDGGCMHIICTRAACRYHWCWVCQVEWSTDCMASHWFG